MSQESLLINQVLKTVNFSDDLVRRTLKVANEERVAALLDQPKVGDQRFIVHVTIHPRPDSKAYTLRAAIFDGQAAPKTPNYSKEVALRITDSPLATCEFSTRTGLAFTGAEELIGAHLQLAE